MGDLSQDYYSQDLSGKSEITRSRENFATAYSEWHTYLIRANLSSAVSQGFCSSLYSRISIQQEDDSEMKQTICHIDMCSVVSLAYLLPGFLR